MAQCQTSLLLSLLTHSPTWADHLFSHLDTALTEHLPTSLESLKNLASGRVTDVRKLSPKPLDLCVAALTLLGGSFPSSVFGSSVAYRTAAGEVGEGTMLRRRVRGGEEDGEGPSGTQEGEGPSEVVTILPANHAELVEVRRHESQLTMASSIRRKHNPPLFPPKMILVFAPCILMSVSPAPCP